MNKTVFALVTDAKYLTRTYRTISDLRTVGSWHGDIVVVTIDFHLSEEYKRKFNIIEKKFDIIDKSYLLFRIGPDGFENSDKREINKLNQWEKFHIFDDYFLNWDRVVFLDAGLRVLDNVSYILELNYKGKLLAPIDGIRPRDIFRFQVDHGNEYEINKLISDFGHEILDSRYMLNCIWVYDTNILKICNKKQLIDAMNKYPICRTNEMTIMNILFHFKYKLWEPFPSISSNGKYLFEWCDGNNPNTNWRNYCFLKYPISISINSSPI